MTTLPMFPLGSVLFPHMPLRLRVFEQRYLVMLRDLLHANAAEFGVVLIERGQEVGGGEHRFRHGTVAEITQLGAQHGFVGLVAEGRRRLEVLAWLDDNPHPKAEVRELPELVWDDSLRPLRQEAERLVRRTLAMASEFAEQVWPVDVELGADPVVACWQLAGIAPLNAMDQLSLLQSETMLALLSGLIEATTSVALTLDAPWPGD